MVHSYFHRRCKASSVFLFYSEKYSTLGRPGKSIRQLRTQAAGVYCWNTVPGYDEVVYQIANNGYPVILCNVGNFY